MTAPTVVGRRPSHAEETRRRRRWRPPPGQDTSTFWLLLAVVVVLNLFGLVMVLSASSVVALDETGSTWSYFTRQSLWAALGSVGLMLALWSDRRSWRRASRTALLVVVGLLVLVFVPGVGVEVNGSTRWLGAGPLQIQPSEFAKLALLLFTADLLARRHREISDPRRSFWPVVGVLGGVAALILAQPNLGTTVVLVAIVFAMLYVAGTRGGLLAGVGLAAVTGATFLVLSTPFRRRRFLTFLDPGSDTTNSGYQTFQALIGLSDGGLTGVGLGASRAKWGYLPFAQTDFIFAIIGEEFGLLGSLGVVVLFVALALGGVRVAVRAADRFSALVATGITTWLVVQAFVNIGAVISILPVTGVPLPFVSFGGSSLLVTMTATGMLLNIARHSRHEVEPATFSRARRTGAHP